MTSAKLALASNLQNEIDNIWPIWNLFQNICDMWTVVDSGSTDGTQEKLKEVVGTKLSLISSDMIKTIGYGFSRTKLIEFSEGMDWILIIDGDERMSLPDVVKLKAMIDEDTEHDLIWLPRCHFQD
jgi:glycosyltransferase involved in cell wall biosynthesis